MLTVHGPLRPGFDAILSPAALRFVGDLVATFAPRVDEMLALRQARKADYVLGVMPDFLPETRAIREADWTVAPLPHDLLDRRVEITGPVDRKMIINALNSGANVFMADFEDANAPTWDNTIQGQINLRDAARHEITYTQPNTGKHYQLNANPAVLMVRPRGWHLQEAHLRLNGRPAPASLIDFGLYFFHNAHALIERGSGPYFYLPKLESHLEAQLWNDVFVHAQAALGIPEGTIKATVLIETLPGAFQMDEILWALRAHSAGLNCGRWDYIFSFIKTTGYDPARVLPDRAQVGMTQPFMRAYTQRVIQVCHRREVHAMGGMAAQIPIKGDPAANEVALAKVRADKLREVKDGHDGTWVAHPGLVGLARAIFDAEMPTPNQIHRKREDVAVTAEEMRAVPEGTRSEAGLRHGLLVSIRYLQAWMHGEGCVPLYDLMEDAATAEISRSQIWQWIRHGAALDDGRAITPQLVRGVMDEAMASLRDEIGVAAYEAGDFAGAADLFFALSTSDELIDFLTLPAYDRLTRETRMESPVMITTHETTADLMADRFEGIARPYSSADVARMRGSFKVEHSLARRGAERLWAAIKGMDYVNALGAISGNQAVQMVRAGVPAIYLSGWQVAADGNLALNTYPDQSLYPADSVPKMVQRINNALLRADQIEHSEGAVSRDWLAPIVADAEAGFGGPLNAYELMKAMIEAGAAGVHFEDQLAAEKKCGHMGGKVLIPTSQFIRTLVAARLAADVADVPTVLIARTDADSAKLLTSDIDPIDRPFLTGERTAEGFFRVKSGMEACIARGLAYAPYADMIWMETAHPDLEQARTFAEAIHAQFPGKPLAYNCSPSFNWKQNLDDDTIAKFQDELGAMGYKFQFVTLAGFHALNLSMFELAKGYKARQMAAYSELQAREFALESEGYTATRHQREVGTGYFDALRDLISAGESSTGAMHGSTEEEQF
ncbi:malate synthase A [Myxococcota bacterium]|nr:malate synthase A [Myxococcota bacterium]MBU1900004.1 malate synthase A [Myxococcota bacterium]